MSVEHLEVDSKTSESDIYAALMLSKMLDSEQDEVSTSSPNNITDQSSEILDTQNVIWVPADKHPQIAPNEFATFIKTHGMNNTPNRRSSSLHRRKSILSQSISRQSEEEDQELNRTLSEKKRQFLKKVLEEGIEDSSQQTFDRHSAAMDDSKIIAPRSDKSLLRRSAFSARGRNRKTFTSEDRQRRSASQRRPSTKTESDDVKSVKSNHSWDKSKGVSLYDRPVNMSEWIDLGSASLDSDESQRGIISRVQDAESQLRSQLDIENDTDSVTEKPVSETKEEVPATIEEERPKRPGIIRSDTDSSVPLNVTFVRPSKPEKRSSWLGGLFNDKKKPNQSSPLTGISNLFNRSLSLKSTPTTLKHQPIVKTTISNHTSTTTTTTTTNNNNNNNNNNNRPSRLEIPPPSERTFFNSNRLPLHVERAIYRLSHMKLTDPKRPLQQQVLISNLMFWYLSIQQQDLQQTMDQRVEAESLPVPDTQQKKGGKMSRLFKKRRSEVAQFIANYPVATINNRPPLKQPNVQFSLPEIPTHHHHSQTKSQEEEEEDDDVPLSYYRN